MSFLLSRVKATNRTLMYLPFSRFSTQSAAAGRYSGSSLIGKYAFIYSGSQPGTTFEMYSSCTARRRVSSIRSIWPSPAKPIYADKDKGGLYKDEVVRNFTEAVIANIPSMNSNGTMITTQNSPTCSFCSENKD